MKKTILTLVALGMFATPLIASAHALPVDSSPASSGVVDTAPSSVSITFSEHIDAGASSIRITDASGALVSGAAYTDPGHTETLHVPLHATADGTYIVSWSVVSSDDGHFTRGAYPFAVGKNQVITSAASDDVEIVEIATGPEAFASAWELLGHGFLWAALLLFAFGIRPLINTGRFDAEAVRLRRGYGWFVSIAALFVIVGGAAQLSIKSAQLAGLQSLPLQAAFTTYAGTAAGAATVYRILAIITFLLIFFIGRRTIVYARKFTRYEIGLVLALMVFAFMRAKISHATSNPFFPDLSILVNFFHVIEKDIWSGILAILLLLIMRTDMRRFLDALIPAAFRMLAIDFAAVSVTAVYIVWLHLKSFGNLFTTQWGSAFLELFIMAVLLVFVRSYHIAARLYRPRIFARMLPATLAIEFALAVMVVYTSSVVIITSPPLAHPPVHVFSAHDQGLTITLAPDVYKDGYLLLSDTGADATGVPVVTVQDMNSGEDPIAVQPVREFSRGFSFPEGLLAGAGPFTISITVSQPGAYDAHAVFTVTHADLIAKSNGRGDRSFDAFTLVMLMIAGIVLVAAVPLYRLSGAPASVETSSGRQFRAFVVVSALLITLFIATSALRALHGSALENPFAAECIADGNEWHIMLPSIAGVPTSQSASEGCMWGMGNYMYMFPDRRAYDYYKQLGPATVSLAPQTFTAGIPATITVSLKNADGTPATMFIDMEKIAHMVIISSDESVFAHIHADDVHPIPAQALADSTFTFNYTFPKAGDYLVAVDYAHGISLESKQFKVHVNGAPAQSTLVQYPTQGVFDGYTVSLDYPQPQVGEITTIKYTITKNGAPVRLVPYLSAAMHIAVVKNDFSWYLHLHGEYHVLGTPVPPLWVRDGQVVHSMAMMTTPDTFTSPLEAHFIIPSPGLYTIWGQFKTASGDLVATAFTMRVE